MTERLVAFLAVLLLSACASERVVLLPSTDGRPSKVIIRNAAGERILENPYDAVAVKLGIPRSYEATAAGVKIRYRDALQALPPRAVSYILYFEIGSDQMTPASLVEFERVRQAVAERSTAEVRVIGHTDRVGSPADNDVLSTQRAQLVRDLLIAAGVPAEKLEVAGRGERELLVPTADEVDEPRNRRVEISIR